MAKKNRNRKMFSSRKSIKQTAKVVEKVIEKETVKPTPPVEEKVVEETIQQKTVETKEKTPEVEKIVVDPTPAKEAEPVKEDAPIETVEESHNEEQTIETEEVAAEKIPVIDLVTSPDDKEKARQKRVLTRKPLSDKDFIKKHSFKIAQLMSILDKSIAVNSNVFKELLANVDRLVSYKGADYTIFVERSYDQASRTIITHAILNTNGTWVPEFDNTKRCINIPKEEVERLACSFDNVAESSASESFYKFCVGLGKTKKMKSFLKYFLTSQMTELKINQLHNNPLLLVGEDKKEKSKYTLSKKPTEKKQEA